MFYFAEVEPGFILMVLIWLFSSFFSKKGKKGAESNSKNRMVGNFEKLLKKFGELPNMDMNQAQPIFPEYEEDIFEDEIIEPHSGYDKVADEKIERVKKDFKTEPPPKKRSVHPEVKLFGTPLQKAMVLNEILAKPRSLRPFDL